MKVVVTGGAGFIGSHLAEALVEEGHDIVILDNLSTGRLTNVKHIRDHVKLLECDLGVAGDWIDEFCDVDHVFHLAALADIVPSIQEPDAYFQANVDGTYNVLRASQKAGVKRFIYVASSSSYGIPDIYPTSENTAICPQYPYALTKYIGEELVLHWAKVYRLPALSLRLFNVYGPRSRTSGTYGAVFGVFLAQKLAGEPFTVVGDGYQTRDFTYVTDVVRALTTASNSDQVGKAYNVGSGVTVSVNELVKLLGGDKVYIPKRPGEPDCTYADISQIRKELGWEPQVTIEQGVTEMLKRIEYWREAPVWTPDSIAGATREWFRYLDDSDRQ